jgi:pre-mRNA-processing factor 40
MLSQCSWREYKAENGRIYYHNIDTKESRWTKPKELEDIEKMISQQQSGTDSPNTYVKLNKSISLFYFYL